jgi:hypothetical protein
MSGRPAGLSDSETESCVLFGKWAQNEENSVNWILSWNGRTIIDN